MIMYSLATVWMLAIHAAAAFKISQDSLGKEVDGRYKLLKHIGSGSYGKVYSALDKESNNKVAVKLEKITTASGKRIDQEDLALDMEYRRYEALTGTAGIPRVWWYGVFDTNYQALIIDLYDTSLRNMLKTHNGSLPVATIVTIASKLLPILENIHNHYIVHRDIKPHNIGVNFGVSGDEYFFFDFGISKLYMNKKDQHIRFRDNKGVRGTVTYASMNAMLGFELSRRDDLESLGYTLLTLREQLPWYWVQSSHGSTENDLAVIKSRAQSSLQEICRGLPVEFLQYFNYVRALGFAETPDYAFLTGLFQHK